MCDGKKVSAVYRIRQSHQNPFSIIHFARRPVFNPLALEMDIYTVAHHLCKMLIFYVP